MRQNEITDLPVLRTENYENLFNVYQDEKDKMYYYNLLQTIAFPDGLPITLFTKYDVVPGDTWPYISYKVYGSPNLWWPIMYANKILDPTKNPVPGTTVTIPKPQVVNEMLSQIGRKR
jgi:LysM repeat protein